MTLDRLTNIPLIFLISAFITLDFSLLFLNLSITKELENDALIINVTGRQRMLSQRIAKSILITCASPSSTDDTQINHELLSSSRQFNQTLLSLKNGGEILAPDGETMLIKALDDKQSQSILNEALALWSEVFSVIDASEDKRDDTYFQTINKYSLFTNSEILQLMNDLTVHSEHLSQKNASTLRQAQIAIFVLVLINFLLIVLRFRRANSNNTAFVSQLDNLVHNLPQAIFLVDTRDKILYANQMTERMFGKTQKEFAGRKIERFIPVPLRNGTAKLSGRDIELTISNVMTIPYEVKMISLLDITESKLLKQKSLFDPLTQLYNRNGLVEAYTQLTQKTEKIICLFLDLDRFKEVNDVYGHSTGDEVLRVVAKRLRSSLKISDIVARFGGDEFVVILENNMSIQEVEHLCSRIKENTKTEIDIEHLSLSVGVSIGVRIGYPGEESLDVIIDDADRAMYADKKHSKKSSA